MIILWGLEAETYGTDFGMCLASLWLGVLWQQVSFCQARILSNPGSRSKVMSDNQTRIVPWLKEDTWIWNMRRIDTWHVVDDFPTHYMEHGVEYEYVWLRIYYICKYTNIDTITPRGIIWEGCQDRTHWAIAVKSACIYVSNQGFGRIATPRPVVWRYLVLRPGDMKILQAVELPVDAEYCPGKPGAQQLTCNTDTYMESWNPLFETS